MKLLTTELHVFRNYIFGLIFPEKKINMNLGTKPIGEFIRETRNNKGISLRKLSFALDLDQSTIAKMEKGQFHFPLEKAPALAEALGINFRALQIALLASVVLQEVGNEEYVSEGLKMAVKQLEKTK